MGDRVWFTAPLWVWLLLLPLCVAAWLISAVIALCIAGIDRWDDWREARAAPEGLPRLIR